MSFADALSDMHDTLFEVMGEAATLAGSPCVVVVDRNVDVMNGAETEVYVRVNTGTFPASVTPVRNQELKLSTGEAFRIGDEIEADLYQKRFILKQ